MSEVRSPNNGTSAIDAAAKAQAKPEMIEAAGEQVVDVPPVVEFAEMPDVAEEEPAAVPGSKAHRPERRSFLAPKTSRADAGRAVESEPRTVSKPEPPPEADRESSSATVVRLFPRPAEHAEPPKPEPAELAERAQSEPEQPEIIPPRPAAPRSIISPEPALDAASEPPPRRFPLRFGFGIGSVVVIVLGVAAVVIASIVWFKPFAPNAAPKPPAHETTAAPAAPSAPEPAQLVAEYLARAKAGDVQAQLDLAILYAKGEGVPQDYATAATWFRAAGEKGNPRAQYDLGVLYERGRGVQADPAEAVAWYRKAAENNFALAQYNLAVAYTKGQGTAQDDAEAARWYRRAAQQGVIPAMVNLAILYERGEGVGLPASTLMPGTERRLGGAIRRPQSAAANCCRCSRPPTRAERKARQPRSRRRFATRWRRRCPRAANRAGRNRGRSRPPRQPRRPGTQARHCAPGSTPTKRRADCEVIPTRMARADIA